jgi:hypothetical protein
LAWVTVGAVIATTSQQQNANQRYASHLFASTMFAITPRTTKAIIKGTTKTRDNALFMLIFPQQ